MRAGWVCWRDDFPAYKWFSASDDSGSFPPITCTRVERVPPGGNASSWLGWWKIARLIESWPW
jgi:hypothetical protein